MAKDNVQAQGKGLSAAAVEALERQGIFLDKDRAKASARAAGNAQENGVPTVRIGGALGATALGGLTLYGNGNSKSRLAQGLGIALGMVPEYTDAPPKAGKRAKKSAVDGIL